MTAPKTLGQIAWEAEGHGWDWDWGVPAATAEADAYSMSLIREFVLSLSQPDTSNEQP